MAKFALFYYLIKKRWRDIYWTNKYYYVIGSKGYIRIIRKLGERYYPNYIHHSYFPKQQNDI